MIRTERLIVATYVVVVRSTDELCAAGTNGCLDLRRRAMLVAIGVTCVRLKHDVSV